MKYKTEPPRLRLVSTHLGPSAEMARWLLEQRAIPYCEEAHAPIFHAWVSRRQGVDIQLPLALTPEGSWAGVKAFLNALDEKSRPGEKVFGESEAERVAAHEAIDLFYERLFWPAVQVYYHCMLDHRATVTKYALDRAPLWQKAIVRFLFPLWKRAMWADIKLNDFSLKDALRDIEAVFDYVEEKVVSAGPFLGGNSPSGADIVFASLASLLVLPDKFPAPLPTLDELPADYRSHVEKFRKRAAGKLVVSIYKEARTTPQVPLKMPSQRKGLAQLLLRPGLIVWLARTLGRIKPYLSFRNTVFVLSWRHVTEVLQRDADFLIGPVNGEKIRAVSGPFILGMDRSPDLFNQREAVYSALRAADMNPVREIMAHEPARLLSAAKERHGRIDVVNGYARLVAMRTAAQIFGIHGPTEQDMMRVIRAAFHEIFLNLGNDPAVRSRGIAAGKELAGWIDEEIALRHSTGNIGSDVLAGLIQAQSRLPLEPESVRWMVAGLIIGSVDTTATAVANIMAVLVNDRRLLSAARNDLGDNEKMLGWCYEALRFRPHNPIILRKAAYATTIGDKQIKAGASVVAVTISAMQDPAAFPQPGKIDPQRAIDRYLHFGCGLHKCSGRDLNAIQVPRLVTELLRFGATGKANAISRGPFPDELILELKG